MIRQLDGIPDEPDESRLRGVVASGILRALQEASARLTQLGVRHQIIGGLAVGAWGHPRATKDVDFLIQEQEVFEKHGPILAFKPGIPISANGVAIDYLVAEQYGLKVPEEATGEFVGLEVLFLLKLLAHRMQDDADIVALINKGVDVERISKWLKRKRRYKENRRLAILIKRADIDLR